ncbi:hypothetical protein AB0L00_19310 [Actinoallomurus sp. NPDC052308]|uniref:hypothetical protein n=1 Tax=Actinoallomurus sp. NPDC052308 TaxID=3155530 RepID=UPI003419A8C2
MAGGAAEGEAGAKIISWVVKDLAKAMWRDTEADAAKVTEAEVRAATEKALARMTDDLAGKTEKEVQEALRKEAEAQLKRQLENQARKLRLPADSIAFRYRNLTVEDYAGRFLRGGVWRELGSEYRQMTVEEALKTGNSKVRKILTDLRDKFRK